MPIRFRESFFARSLLIFASLPWMATSPSTALEAVSPGGTVDFLTADACSTLLEIPRSVEDLARAHASCSASQRLLRAEVRPITGPRWVGLRTVRASATMGNDFAVPADPETPGNTVGAWITCDAGRNGRVLSVGFFSPPRVELAIRPGDLTDAKVIKGELVWGRDGQGAGICVPYIPFHLNPGGGVDNLAVSTTFPAVLTRGHKYRLEVALTCAAFPDGGLDVDSECDYMDDFLSGRGGGAGWSKLGDKVGLDEAKVQKKLEALASHTPICLTGKGVGHNNTGAGTSEPVEGSARSPRRIDRVTVAERKAPGPPPGHPPS